MFKFLLAALLAASAQALPGVSVDAVLDEIRSAPIGWPESKASAVKGTATLSAGGDREHYIAHKDGHKHFSGSMSLAQATADGWYKRDDPTPETPMLDHDLMPERARTNLKGATQLNQLEQKINKAQQLEAKAAFVPAEPRLAQLLQMEAKEEKVKPMEGTENLFAINVPPPADDQKTDEQPSPGDNKKPTGEPSASHLATDAAAALDSKLIQLEETLQRATAKAQEAINKLRHKASAEASSAHEETGTYHNVNDVQCSGSGAGNEHMHVNCRHQQTWHDVPVAPEKTAGP